MSDGSHSPTLRNRKARHDYHVLDTVEAGLVLVGCEVKSIRQGHASLGESYAAVDANGEVWLIGMHVNPYTEGGAHNPPPTRKRKLLLHRAEIRKLKRELEQKGRTLVPLALFFKRGKAKVELGVCVGKKLHDKRDALKERDLDRDAHRELVSRGSG